MSRELRALPFRIGYVIHVYFLCEFANSWQVKLRLAWDCINICRVNYLEGTHVGKHVTIWLTISIIPFRLRLN